jgi:uridine kinase
VADALSPIEGLLETLRGVDRRRRTLLVGIDGGGGAGKSTLAREIRDRADGVTIIEFDDFYRPSFERKRRAASKEQEVGGNFDWRRLRSQVLLPLAQDQSTRYQRYDWVADELADWVVVPVGGIVIVEGCYCIRRDLFSFYDSTIWVETPPDLRLQRGLARGGADTRDRWLREWLPEEERYVEAENPSTHAHLVIAGTWYRAQSG